QRVRPDALDVHRLYCRVEPDGSSDLARAFGLEVAEGETLMTAARQLLVDRAAEGARSDGGESQLDVTVQEARIEEGGALAVLLEGVEFSTRSHGHGYEFELSNCTVSWPGEDDPRDVSGRLVFGADGTLARGRVRADAIPFSTLRCLGWVGRDATEPGPDPGPDAGAWFRAEPHASTASFFRAVGATLTRDGTRIEVEYGPAPVEEGEAPRAERLLSASLEGPGGYLELDGRVVERGGVLELIPRRPQDRQALRFGFEASSDALVPFLEPLAPPGAVVEARGGGGQVRGAARGFRVPLPQAGLRALLEDEPLPWVESMLLASDVQLAMTGPDRGNGLRASVRAEGIPDSAFDRVDLGLLVAELEFASEGGGFLRTTWTTNEQLGAKTFVSLRVPPGGDRDAIPRVDVDARQLPRSLVARYVELPATVAGLLNNRIGRFAVSGVPFGRRAPRGAQPIDFEVYVGYGDDWEPVDPFIGTFDGRFLRVRTAEVDMALGDEGVLRAIFLRQMPWIVDAEPAEPKATVRVEFEDLDIELGTEEQRESGIMTVTSDALRVRLDGRLARELGIPVEDVPSLLADLRPRRPGVDSALASEWIRWEPGPMRFKLNRDTTTFEVVELPLDDDEVMEATGNLVQGEYSLSGTLEKAFLPRSFSDLEETPVEIKGSRGGAISMLMDISRFDSLLEGCDERSSAADLPLQLVEAL
ncbi:MAG: hypothetical protein AAFP22_16715, partial [Planctomycetota bacterium]